MRENASCDYCGLPAGAPADPAEVVYCCLGCRIAAAVAQERGEAGQMRWTLTRLGLGVFFAMNVMVFTLALWTQDVYELPTDGSALAAASLVELFRYLGLIFTLPVVLLLGGPLLENTWAQLRRGLPTTDALLLLGVAAALAYSVTSVVRGSGHVYFEVVCMVLVAVTLGRWLEAAGRLKTTQSLESLHKLLPEKVRLLTDAGLQLIPLAEVPLAAHLQVLPGERIPCDGRIVEGECSTDEQLVSGESRPMFRGPEDTVRGGTLNLDGVLTIEVTALPDEGTLGRLVESVRSAAATKGSYQRLADRITTWFIPGVFLVAALTWGLHAWLGDPQRGLMASLAVVLIACPCALALATPMAFWGALGSASRAGVLLRDGDALTRLAQVRAVCFDKTGTLTSGTIEVARFVPEDPAEENQLLAAAAPLAARSLHSLSGAIANYVRAQGHVAHSRVTDVQTHPGRGQSAVMPDVAQTGRVWLGSLRLMEEASLACSDEIRAEIETARGSSRPVACLGWEGRVRGVFVFCEHARPEAEATLRWLRDHQVHTAVLTGDTTDGGIAKRYGNLVGEVQTGMLPDEKLARLRALRETYGMVAMVGEGLNDAPALAGADVGIALGCGADVSRDSADVCLVTDDLARIPWAMQLAQATVRTVRRNLIWAFAYNTAGIALAAAGWLNPMFAALAMVASSLFVISGSLRLSGYQGPQAERSGDEAQACTADSFASASADETKLEKQPEAVMQEAGR